MGILKNAAKKLRTTVDTAIADEKKAAAIRKKIARGKDVEEASGLVNKYKAQGLTQEEAEFMAVREQKKAKTIGKIQSTAKTVGSRAGKLGDAFDADFAGAGPSGKSGSAKGKKPTKKTGGSSTGDRFQQAQAAMISDVGFGNMGSFGAPGSSGKKKAKGKSSRPGQVPDPFNDFPF